MVSFDTWRLRYCIFCVIGDENNNSEIKSMTYKLMKNTSLTWLAGAKSSAEDQGAEDAGCLGRR